MIQKKSIKKSRLFCVCPECCLETEINNQFAGDCYFLNSFGAELYYSDAFIDAVEFIIQKQQVEEVIFVWDRTCRINDMSNWDLRGSFSKFNMALTNLLNSSNVTITHNDELPSGNTVASLLHEIVPRLEMHFMKTSALDEAITIKIVEFDRVQRTFNRTLK